MDGLGYRHLCDQILGDLKVILTLRPQLSSCPTPERRQQNLDFLRANILA
jgi:hypothetical protein